MRKLAFFLFNLLIINIYCQEIKSDDMFNRIYNRNSVTFIMLAHGDKYDSFILNNFLKEKFSKYNQNFVDFNVINTTLNRNASQKEKEKMITETLKKEKIAQKVVSVWFNRNDAGFMNMEKIKERGLYNATEYQSLIAEKSHRSFDILKDAGEDLIKKSYVIVFDVSNISESVSKAGILTWDGMIETYLYSIVFNEEIKNEFWDKCWLEEADKSKLSDQDIDKKLENFENFSFKIKSELQTKNTVAKNTSLTMINAFTTFGLAMTENSNNPSNIRYTGDGVAEFNNFMQYAYQTGMQAIEQFRPDFIVKTAINSVKPVAAKIGVKEGLKRKQRYDVYVGSYNEKKDIVESKYVGTVRAAKIANNTDISSGKSMTSEFVTIYQKQSIQPYMTIQQKNDKQISLFADFIASSGNGIFSVGIENLNFITKNSFSGSLLMDLVLSSNKGDYYKGIYDEYIYMENISFLVRLGYSLGINLFHPNLKLSTFLNGGFGACSFSHLTYTGYWESYSYIDATYSYGLKLGYNFTNSIQLYYKIEKFSTAWATNIPFCSGFGLKYSL